MSITCVYCLQNGHLRDEQVLLRGDAFYLCAPRGQLIEGFLVIAPYRCMGCLAQLPDREIDELLAMQELVRAFYARTYDTRAMLFYEQGRAGGGALTDPNDRFPLHAHLCGLPAAVNLHGYLRHRYLPVPVSSLAGLATAVHGQPYLYVETSDQRLAYLARLGVQSVEIEGARLKPVIARLMGISERGDWRAYPGGRELQRLVENWRQYWDRQA